MRLHARGDTVGQAAHGDTGILKQLVADLEMELADRSG